MDLATIIGIVLAFGLVISAMMMGGSIMMFVSIPSALVVIGGTIGACLINYPLGHMLGVMGVVKNAFFTKGESSAEIINKFMDYANRARREGILSLEPVIKEIDDDYLKKRPAANGRRTGAPDHSGDIGNRDILSGGTA